ncbi:MAG: molecular chaperone HtpG [Ectothiorhodospiraceae bacterium]|nr:molecular chaperone HtpG [Chromatiales bacterium]MCP5153943.1 molecular chaperone HtpG [Ectothiorhodospiraceae bacterium]
MAAEAVKEKHGFQTEVKRLLDLMVHSLYSNAEIFLRELVSNASDAADKLRFEALADESLLAGDADLAIDIEVDRDARTITVRDNGVGMSEQEVKDNLGTIARSGTREFLDALSGDKARDAQLIGQFGVGFYSSFIVADRVTVTTRRAGLGADAGVRWESTGDGEYTIEHLEVPRRGTEVVLHVREDADEFLDAYRLRAVVRKYSDHILLPIRMRKETPPGDAEKAADAEPEWERVNAATALWARPRNEITDDEYETFYKHVSHDFEAPFARVHSRVEGNLEYTLLLYVPTRPPFDLWDRTVRRGVKLYVRRVFIMDDAEQLMPAYLRFVRGIVDSADLPLNISREILQHNRHIDSMRAGCVKRVLDLLAGIASDEPDRYVTFWDQFGRVLKEGVFEDARNRDAIAKLLRFASTKGDGSAQRVSLADYVGRMKEGQEKIYYLTADSYATAASSPHLEVFRKKDVEVLLLVDEVDEWVVHHLTEFEGKHLQSVARGKLDLDDLGGDDEKPSAEERKAEEARHQSTVEAIKALLGERVKDVRASDRLTDSPACLVADEHDPGGHLQRLLEASGQKVEGFRPILEVNADHPLVARLDAESDASRREDLASILLDQATLSEGGRLDDPADFVRRVNRLLVAAP